MTFDLRAELSRFGAAEASIKLLDEPRDASVLRYVDLFPESLARKDIKGMPAPAGVVEHDGRPLLYVYRADALSLEPVGAIPELVRSLACRGEGHFLAIVRPGEIVVYPVGLLKQTPIPEVIQSDNPRSRLLIAELAAGRMVGTMRQQLASATSLHDLLFELITSVAQALRHSGALSIERHRDEVLPLVGRAVFTRFLIDRGIINPQTYPDLYAQGGRPEDAFATPQAAARTCAWLDATFNGELLPLLFDRPHPSLADYEQFFTRPGMTPSEVLHQLTNVMFRAPNGRLALGFAWDGVDFAHVPVGLLSEVYEDYAHKFYRDEALLESVRYTPRHLAEFTVQQAFAGLPQAERASARVLDPAAGAGIFLVLAYQQLVREHWWATGQRPDTASIRAILNRQIRGFDINASALTLAALSLYLTALEVDPDPFPPEKLRFERLLGSVLRNVRDEPTMDGEKAPLVLGSLGNKGDLDTESQFSIVTGNPPWTAYAKWHDGTRDFNAFAAKMARRVLAEHRSESSELQVLGATYVHNDQLPDTAFLWRAMEWARPDGVIAFIVAGRLLFKRGEGGTRVRETLFQSMQVTGILNGALLLPLWKEINQPFCILFARNRIPAPTSRMTLVTPVLDEGPDGQPRMRIDAEARQPLALSVALARPYLFKALTRGGRLDVDIVERIQMMARPADSVDPSSLVPTQTIREQWTASWTENVPRFGQGFIPVGPRTNSTSQKVRERLAQLRAKNAAVLTPQHIEDEAGALRIGLRILPQQVDRLDDMALYRLAAPAIFEPPIVVVSEGFGPDPQQEPRARLYLGKAPLVVSRSYYAFSCAGHPQAVRQAKLLFCIINSDLFGYYTLVHSAKFGLERRTLLVEDIMDFPMPISLSDRQFIAIERVADALALNDDASWLAMNRCINQLYGLSPVDEQVILDTLSTQMPYSKVRKHAAAPVTNREREVFRRRLESMLQPFFTPDGETVTVRALPEDIGGWIAFEVEQQGAVQLDSNDDTLFRLATALSEDEGASRLVFVVGLGRVRVVLRNQYRYLTSSQARLCALDLLREHGSAFPLPMTTA